MTNLSQTRHCHQSSSCLCLAGFLAERTGSYDEPFYMTGALLIIASLLGFLATAWGKWSCHARPEERSSSYRRAESVDA